MLYSLYSECNAFGVITSQRLGASTTERQAVKVKLKHEAYSFPDETLLSGGNRSIKAEPDRHQLDVELNLFIVFGMTCRDPVNGFAIQRLHAMAGISRISNTSLH